MFIANADLQGSGMGEDFTENLRWLFEHVPGPDGQRITTERLVELVRQQDPDVRMSISYAAALRRGAKANPSASVVDAVARAFAVPTAFFFDADLRGAIQRGVLGLTDARDQAVLRLQRRIETLNEEQLMQLMALIDTFTPRSK